MLKSLPVVSSILLYSTIAFSQVAPVDRSHWSQKDFWMEVKLGFEANVKGSFNNELCYSNYAQFSGCVHALSRGLQLAKNDGKYYVLKPNPGATGISGFDIVVLEFQDTADVKAKLTAYSNELASWYKANAALVLKRVNFERSYADFQKKYVNVNNESYLTAIMMNAFLEKSADPHTYFTPTYYQAELAKGTTAVGGVKGAVGISMSPIKYLEEDKILIRSVMKGSVAEESGIEEGDIILEINGKTSATEMTKVLSTEETMEFLLDGSQGRRSVKLTRRVLNSDSVESTLYRSQNDRLIGYIKFTTFMDQQGCDKVTKAGQKLLVRGAKALILDLRDNGGGRVDVATCINDQFLEKSSLHFVVQNLQTNKFSAEMNNTVGKFKNIHAAVLINGSSASASEIVSTYLQAYRKAYIVGENSFGKGTMQSVGSTRNPLIQMAQTVAKYYGPQGVSPQLQGITPDIEAYPDFTQKKPTEYSRERDMYDNAIVNDGPETPVMEDRLEEVQKIKGCLQEEEFALKSYMKKDEFKRRVHDNQKSVAIGTLDCALKLNLPVFNRTDIPSYFKNK